MNKKLKIITNLSKIADCDLERIVKKIGKAMAGMYKLNQEKEKSNST